MAGAWGQSILRVQISNKTRNTTLKYQRFKDYWRSQELQSLHSLLSPGRSDSGFILSRSNTLGRGWLLIYEVDSFTLAIFFFLPKEPEHSRKILQLEVSQDKAHLGDIYAFRETFDRMAALRDPPDPDRTDVSRAEFSGSSRASVRLLSGPYKVSANVTRHPMSDLEVQLEERAVRR